ncbi:DUF1924 domain-containing protein [Limnohabitans sp. Rim47]|uniref:DUF1924 domain-containing protein n=2 Tax=Limnohabitans sp. Rim47 TaxID=1100721 RepID=UPI000308276C
MLNFRRFRRMAVETGIGLALIGGVPAMAATPQTELLRWQQAAGQAGDAVKGQVFFGQRQGGEWSCASCHGQPPTRDSQHASTGKKIAALAPAFNAERLTDSAKVDKWFKRNCKDVLSRECTAIEKADVLAYLIGLK